MDILIENYNSTIIILSEIVTEVIMLHIFCSKGQGCELAHF